MNIEIIKRIMPERNYITIAKKPCWKTVNAEIEKNKRIINKYLNEQHLGNKRTNLYWSESSL